MNTQTVFDNYKKIICEKETRPTASIESHHSNHWAKNKLKALLTDYSLQRVSADKHESWAGGQEHINSD